MPLAAWHSLPSLPGPPMSDPVPCAAGAWGGDVWSHSRGRPPAKGHLACRVPTCSGTAATAPWPRTQPTHRPGPTQNPATPWLRSCSGTCLASQRPRVSEDLPGPSTRSVSRHFLRCDMPAKRGGGCGGGHSGSESSGKSAHAAALRIRATRQP